MSNASTAAEGEVHSQHSRSIVSWKRIGAVDRSEPLVAVTADTHHAHSFLVRAAAVVGGCTALQ